MKRTARTAERIPAPCDLHLPSKDYQPSKAEMEEEFDMPGMSDDQVREAFFRPVKFVRNGSKSGNSPP